MLKSETQREDGNDSEYIDDEEDMIAPNSLFFKNDALLFPKFPVFPTVKYITIFSQKHLMI